MIEDDVEWALKKAIDLLEEWHPEFDEDPTISEILDIYNTNFN